MAKRGRPKLYDDGRVISLSTINAKLKLQELSERRAIVDRVVDSGGRVTIGDLCESFGYDVTPHLKILKSKGWIDISGE